MDFVPLAPLLAILGIMLSLAVLVERFMMVFNWLIDRLWALKVLREWDGEAQLAAGLQLAERAKAESDELEKEVDSVDDLEDDPEEIEVAPSVANGPNGKPRADEQFEVKPAKKPNDLKVFKEFYMQILGAAVAIIVCFVTKFSAWPLFDEGQVASAGTGPAVWELVFTGIIIGAGSKPVHFLIEFLVNRKVVVTRQEVGQTSAPAPTPTQPGAAAPTVAPPMPARPVLQNIEDIIGFVYDGGDRPGRLENTHLRKTPVNLLVYHHTAMHSDSPFEAVIREFDRKGWLTGYHCVIMKDGTIHVLCRWDRVGNHARGVNFRSLGVALHGNFEPDPSVSFSNPDGRFGIQHPTQAQVESAARITALWALLHEKTVPLDFPVADCSSGQASDLKTVTGIVPHCHIAPKACPGGNFPHASFQQFVKDYVALWKQDQAFAEALERFKKAPMVIA